MDEWTLFIKIILGILFLWAGYSKIVKFDEHISLLENYKILPSFSIKIFGRIEVVLEIITGLFLLIGVFQNVISLIAASLLLLYTFAISFNLVHGRKEVSCGCGGILGNHKLSWYLVLRNLVLLLGCIYLFKYEGSLGNLNALLSGQKFSTIYGLHFILIVLISSVTLLMSLVFLNLIEIKNKNNFFSN